MDCLIFGGSTPNESTLPTNSCTASFAFQMSAFSNNRRVINNVAESARGERGQDAAGAQIRPLQDRACLELPCPVPCRNSVRMKKAT